MRIDPRLAAALAVGGVVMALVGWLVVADADADAGGRSGGSGIASAAPDASGARSATASAGAMRESGEAGETGAAEQGASALALADPAAASSAASAASAPGTDTPAAWSLADARVAGDDRAPPIQRSPTDASTPAWQLDDHPAYARREQDRHQAVQRAFVEAADQELPLLDQQIARGRAMGLSPEQLAKGEEKRRRIAQMQARMRAALKDSDGSINPPTP